MTDELTVIDRKTETGPIGRRLVWITGVVQGVGFRPFVYRLAHEHELLGWVRNTSAGVEIDVEGTSAALEAFVADLTTEAPPLARIESLRHEPAAPVGHTTFEILHSAAQSGRYQLVSPDIATCPDCLRELLDPTDRRYRYPFTNCTNCGPRFTIIRDIPYDRPKTTMDRFPMCPNCQAEYDDPLDRRFHAQPNACPVCGPQLTLTDTAGQAIPVQDVIRKAADLLADGHILAIKGLGGFHLACDATNAEAVAQLRTRKQRPHKPLAVMLATLDDIEQHALIADAERDLLTSPACPIVLLRWREDSTIAQNVAPGRTHLGVMLPYTPLHHLLLRDVGRPLVMTSGNLSEEPIAQHNGEALQRLGGLADLFVLHDRDIYARYDDSVWFAPQGEPQPIRRSRGYAPFPIHLPDDQPSVLACGPELKNTFCLTRDHYAFLSQHIGDMGNLDTLEYYEQSIDLYQRLFRIEPELLVHDLHPDYDATRYAQRLSQERGLPLLAVQHHHAHIAACMADNGWLPQDGPVIGVALDGTGYGTDGRIWGGEFLIADYGGFRRAGHLAELPMPGGEAAVRRPYRLALAYSHALTGALPTLPRDWAIAQQEIDVLLRQMERGINCPITTSCGRLFDAAAALLGVRGVVSYEAQAAIEMETLARRAGPVDQPPYPIQLVADGDEHVVALNEMWAALMQEAAQPKRAAIAAWRVHRTIAQMALQMCLALRAETGIETVALSGGCFQNRLLLGLLQPLLAQAGFAILTHHHVPSNDGGVSLGQAVIAGLSRQSS